MWIKRTEQEIAAAKLEAKRGRRFISILLGVVVCLGFAFVHIKTRRNPSNTSAFVSLDEIPSRLPFSIVGGVIAGLLFYWSNALTRKTVVCPRCEKTKWQDSQTECSCGGHFEDVQTLRWK
jgi:hypothetical protein